MWSCSLKKNIKFRHSRGDPLIFAPSNLTSQYAAYVHSQMGTKLLEKWAVIIDGVWCFRILIASAIFFGERSGQVIHSNTSRGKTSLLKRGYVILHA